MEKKLISILIFSLLLAVVFTLLSPAKTNAQLNPADANSDGKVDGVDYTIWLIHYEQNVTGGKTKGDFNNDGKVTGLDYVIWLNNLTNSPTNTPTPTNAPSGNLFQNPGFEDGTVYSNNPNDLDPKKWYAAEGLTARGTGRIINEHPEMINVLCAKKSPVKPLEGNCLLKISSEVGVKALAEQSYYPTVIDGTFAQNLGIYVPNLPENSAYLQQMELREGIIPGATGQVIQMRYQSLELSICVKSNNTNDCKTFPPLTKNKWYNFRFTLIKTNETNQSRWALKIEDTNSGKTFWNSSQGDPYLFLRNIPRERVVEQIGTIFFGDECLGPGGPCDGKGVVYYDDISAFNPGGTGLTNPSMAGDANNDRLVDEMDLEIWKDNYLKVLDGQTPNPSNSTGDFRADDTIDGLDYAIWWNRSGQNVPN
ncbi:hypothetical protein HY345_03005 [Candidatus Microgenomates bacterium]|nr:hypothetical protein [Candidatus Microgenomates bacterium]